MQVWNIVRKESAGKKFHKGTGSKMVYKNCGKKVSKLSSPNVFDNFNWKLKKRLRTQGIFFKKRWLKFFFLEIVKMHLYYFFYNKSNQKLKSNSIKLKYFLISCQSDAFYKHWLPTIIVGFFAWRVGSFTPPPPY